MRSHLVVADNPNMMTLDGTNTWILDAPGGAGSVVVDPGPDDAAHLDAVLEAAGPVELILYTHNHPDHTEAFAAMVERTGSPARAMSAQFCHDADPLVDGEVLTAGGIEIRVMHTPGHTADSLCLLAGDSLLTGDTILGRGTTVIAHPDGALGPYLASLGRIKELVDAGMVARFLPGHGPVVDDPAAVVDHYIAHRHDRLDQVRSALVSGATTAREVVEVVYTDVGRHLWPAAELSVQAQLDYLKQ